jgi:predicted Zn-dependent peptidase
VDRIDKVTKADIRRVANETFNDTNRTVGVIETSKGAAQGDEQGSRHQGSPDDGGAE